VICAFNHERGDQGAAVLAFILALVAERKMAALLEKLM